MQGTHFQSQAQKPSLALFEESIRTRLEKFALNAQVPLEYYNDANKEAITDYLELTLIELRYLLNEMYLLQDLQQ